MAGYRLDPEAPGARQVRPCVDRPHPSWQAWAVCLGRATVSARLGLRTRKRVGSRSPSSGFQDAPAAIWRAAHIPSRSASGAAGRKSGKAGWYQQSHEGEAVSPARQHLTILDCRMFWVACAVAVKRERSGQCRSPLAARRHLWPLLAKAAVTTDMVFRLLMTQLRVRQESWQRIGGESPSRESLANHPDPE